MANSRILEQRRKKPSLQEQKRSIKKKVRFIRAMDVSLVNSINAILAKGMNVTRVLGLEMAKILLKGKKLACPQTGDNIAIDAKWWLDFI